jgi:hypothetical protein
MNSVDDLASFSLNISNNTFLTVLWLPSVAVIGRHTITLIISYAVCFVLNLAGWSAFSFGNAHWNLL